ncbi:hypothetical protein EU546_05900 [Candidatus Thorarchaeota archaeon]|nr:MAG: hypothetical protein EU546_05900 [Candidatus Thorarchaeota archaeon]
MAKRSEKSPDSSEKKDGHSEKGVVDSLLTELGVDDEMRQELIESGRMSSDVMRVESADQVRRTMELEKSAERLRDSLSLLERNIMTMDGAIDRIERDLVPVVLSFLVSLKGNLVNMRGDIVTKSKRKAKTNLQSTYLDNDVKPIVEEEFHEIEESLTSGMSTPILEKMRDITEGLKESLKLSVQELAALKGSVDDYAQRATTEVEFLAKELGMKPKVEVPKAVEEKIDALETKIEGLENELDLSKKKLENRENEIDGVRRELAATRLRNEDLEEDLRKMSAGPRVEQETLAELRNQVKSLEASREVLTEKLRESEELADASEKKAKGYLDTISEKDLKIGDLETKVRQLDEQIAKNKERMAEMDEIRARLRSYESGDKMRELERVKAELERASGNLSRMTEDYEETKAKLQHAEETLEGYLSLMDSTEKTKAYLMVEEHGEMSIREIARSLGVAPAIVMKWSEEFQDLGIAWIVDGTTLVHRDQKKS